LICPTPGPALRRKPPPAWDLPARIIVSTTFMMTVTLLAASIGPTMTGMASTFPVMLSVMAPFTHRVEGQAAVLSLLRGCIEQASEIDVALGRHVDRKMSELSPVEHGVLMIGVYELKHCIDIPYRVVINEAVELAKSFGGTDGHKFVNGVIDKTAADLRAVEVEAARAARR
jgi:transcription antitermination factor NusB